MNLSSRAYKQVIGVPDNAMEDSMICYRSLALKT